MPGKLLTTPEMISTAEMVVKKTRNAHELRRAQAFLLPYQFSLDIDQTGVAIGKSRPTVAWLRKEFVLFYQGEDIPRSRWGGRRRENMSYEEEKAFLEPFMARAREGGILIVGPVKAAYEEVVGHSVPDSTIYRILARHGWRKIAPDKQHPESDPIAQEHFKKTFRK